MAEKSLRKNYSGKVPLCTRHSSRLFSFLRLICLRVEITWNYDDTCVLLLQQLINVKLNGSKLK